VINRPGAVHKVRHARGGKGVREGVTVCDRGPRAYYITLLKKFIHNIMKPKIESGV